MELRQNGTSVRFIGSNVCLSTRLNAAFRRGQPSSPANSESKNMSLDAILQATFIRLRAAVQVNVILVLVGRAVLLTSSAHATEPLPDNSFVDGFAYRELPEAHFQKYVHWPFFGGHSDDEIGELIMEGQQDGNLFFMTANQSRNQDFSTHLTVRDNQFLFGQIVYSWHGSPNDGPPDLLPMLSKREADSIPIDVINLQLNGKYVHPKADQRMDPAPDLFEADFPANNRWNFFPSPHPVAVDGYYYLLEPLSPGDHEIIVTGVYGRTFHFDISVEPGYLGDFNGSGPFDYDPEDIDILSEQVRAGTNDLVFDLDRNRQVDNEDRVKWVHDIAATRFGDANLDGCVGFGDFVALSGGFGQPGGWAQGDFDGDGSVQFADFIELTRNYGSGATCLENSPRSVPEPNTAMLTWLMLLSVVAVAGRRKRWEASTRRGISTETWQEK